MTILTVLHFAVQKFSSPFLALQLTADATSQKTPNFNIGYNHEEKTDLSVEEKFKVIQEIENGGGGGS
jgi:hypothetical protein